MTAAKTRSPDLGHSLLYLTEQDVQAAMPPAGVAADAIAEAVRGLEQGVVSIKPKTRLEGEGMASFFIMPAAIRGELAGIKWLGGSAGNAALGLPTYGGILALSDATTGMPVALIAASQLTAMRTAILSLLAARALAQPDACRLGLIGAGAQAASHLAALREAFPITRILVNSRGASADRFRERHAEPGLEIEVTDADTVLAESDILVSAVGADTSPFLDAGKVGSGCFVTMADLGRAWRPETLRVFDAVFTDDRESTIARGSVVPQMAAVAYAGDLADLVARPVSPRTPSDRRAFLFAGTPIADLAFGMLVFRNAVNLGIGTVLPL